MARGATLGGIMLTEPDAGSDLGALRTTYRRDGGRFLLDGAKAWITNAGVARTFVVLATRDQLLPDLAAGFALLQNKYGDRYPSCMSLITGPSRTGDIERILVLGAHGPKRLTSILILHL